MVAGLMNALRAQALGDPGGLDDGPEHLFSGLPLLVQFFLSEA